MGFPGSSAGKKYVCNAGDPSSVPGSERSPGERIGNPLQYSWASLVAQSVKNPSVMRGTWVQSLAWEDPLEKVTATYSSILAWRIPWGCKDPGFSALPSGSLGQELLNNWHSTKSMSTCCSSKAASFGIFREADLMWAKSAVPDEAPWLWLFQSLQLLKA